MAEIAWQEFSKAGRIVNKRKEFQTDAAMERYIEKLMVKDSFYRILATRGEER